MKRQNLYSINYDLRGHQRPQKVIIKFQNHPFLRFIFNLKLFKNVNIIKTFFHKIKYDLKDLQRSYKTTFMPNSSWHIHLWTDFDANIMKTQSFLLNYT